MGAMLRAHGYGRLLLLCVVFSEVRHCWTRPLDFVCRPEARSQLNIIGDLEADMKTCSGSDRLPLPLHLPCIRIRKTIWDQMSLQQKRASVCAALGVLLHGIKSAKRQSGLDCQTSILQRLEHNVQNHLHILKHLKMKGAPGPTEATCEGPKTDSLAKALQLYGRLLQGPLELLLLELSDSCTDTT